MINEYSRFFSADMSYDEAQEQLFKVSKRLPDKEERDKLFEAYREVAGNALGKSLDETLKGGYIT